MVAATLSSAGAWLFELSAAVRAGGNIEMALGWLAQQCGALGEEATAAVKEVDAALAALLAEAKVEASAVKERPGYTLGREGA
jgi:hypothetical protein